MYSLKTFTFALLSVATPLVFSTFSLDRSISTSSDSTYAHTQPSKVLHLSGYLDNGMLSTFKKGQSADMYFGLFALSLAARNGLDTGSLARPFLEFGLANQEPSGLFPRFCKSKGAWQPCGKSDSDDATLARWLEALYRFGKALPDQRQVQASFKLAESALDALLLPGLGVYSVFPKGTPNYDGYALFKDNVEVLNCFSAISEMAKKEGDSRVAGRFKVKAAMLRGSMEKAFGPSPFGPRKLALGADYTSELFYPHAASIPFAWNEGYYAVPSADDWDRWEGAYLGQWRAQAKAEFPWGILAVSALNTGNRPMAQAWLRLMTPLRDVSGHWNILEETSYEILRNQLPLPG